MKPYRPGILWAALLVASAACTDLDSATNLNPEGPPMVRQVRMREVTTNASGSVVVRRVFAFGTHPQAASGDYPTLGANTMVTGVVTGQTFRIIMDELLVGNNLEEIACRAPVDDDAYDRVPLGTTPDDIARCAVAKDVLPSSCPGNDERSVCICKIDGGCGDVPLGGPVGVLDVNQDGAADDTRFIAGAVGLRCGTIDVPIDLNNSYWNPSGDQNKPAMGGFDALGPAIVLVPDGPMPTNVRCNLSFSPDVVDKQHNGVCVPPEGDVARGCTPGDMSAFEFSTQALTISNQSFVDGEMNVDPMAPVIIVATAPLDPGSLGAITVSQGATPVTDFTVTLPQPQSVRINWNTPLAPDTEYTLNISTALTDTFGQPLVEAASYTFTTAP